MTALDGAPVLAATARGSGLSPVAKCALIVEVLAAYPALRRAVRRHGLPAALERARDGSTAHPDAVAPGADPEIVRAGALRLARAVDRTLAAAPTDSRCLMRALVVCALLSRRGVQTTFVIGAAPSGDFVAHAWVELDGRALQPTQECPRLVSL